MKLHHKIFLVLCALLPVQLGYHFWPDWAFIFGVRVDYLAPTIYLTDLLAITLIGVWWIQTKKTLNLSFQKHRYRALFFIIFIAANIYFAQVWQVAFFKWLKIGELVLLSWYVFTNWKSIKLHIFTHLLVSLLVTLVVCVGQMLTQKTLGLWILGERSFASSTPGIALVNLFGADYLRPYGTFSHPNSLAGFALLLLALNLSFSLTTNIFLKRIFNTLCLLLVGISFSQAAWGVAIIIVGLNFLRAKQIKMGLVVSLVFFASFVAIPVSNYLLNFFVRHQTILERLEMIRASSAFVLSPFGVGAGNGAQALNFNQPVHNTVLLTLTELGLVGLILFFVFFQKLAKNPNYLLLLVILGTGFFDHYWLTLQQNMLLLAVTSGILWTKSTST